MYNAYDMNQQKSDDLRVLKSTAVLEPSLQTLYPGYTTPTISSPLFQATYEVNLPSDYLHILNCIIEYKVLKNSKCYTANSYVQFGAKRLTGDMWSQIINNYYMRPAYNNPYFYLNNVNTKNTFPTEDSKEIISDTLINKESDIRYGNRDNVRMELRFGTSDKTFKPTKVYIDYLKSPQHIILTQEQIDAVEDTSQLLEFPDYVVQEIIKELVTILMENSGNPRLQSYIPINQSIAFPQGQPTK